jgi:hypothetical protein
MMLWMQLSRMSGRPGELDSIRRGPHELVDHGGHVLDAGDERGLPEEPVVHGDVQAAAGFRMEETVQSVRHASPLS